MIQAKKMPQIVRYIAVLLMLFGITTTASAQTQPNPLPLYYTGIVGGEEPQGQRVLLRWFTLDAFIPLESSIIYRTDKNNVREKIAVVKQTRSSSLIQNIFFRPGEERILEDAQATFERIYGIPGDDPEEFAEMVVDILEGEDVSEYATTRRNFLIQTNYGFAMVEGYGYLDFVNPLDGPYIYELWQGDAQGNELATLGKIEIDASQQMILPPPADLKEIFLNGRDGVTPARANHRRIFLDWEVPPALFEKRDINFGFDIYKLDRALNVGETYDDVVDDLIKVNDLPILPPSPIAGEPDDQSYLFADDGEWLQTLDENDLLPVGDTYTYWAVARDLLGNIGEPSNALEATVRDTFEPDFPRGLNIVPSMDENDNPFLKIIWNKQIEDTDAYRLYRYQAYANQGKFGPFADIDGLTEGFIVEVPQDNDPQVDRIEFDDYDPATAERGKVFWYCIAAIDEHGNISALSPPARGVLDDVLPPVLDEITDICGSRVLGSVIGSVSLEPEGRTTTWRPLFKIKKDSSVFTRVRIISDSPIEDDRGRPVAIADFPLAQSGTQYFEPEADDIVTNVEFIPTYEIQAETFEGEVLSTTINPPSWTLGNPRACYEVTLGSRGYEEACLEPGDANDPIQIGVFPGGDIPPVRITSPCPGDTETLRLYRSVNGGRTYTFVKEVSCEEANSLEIEDDFHPDGLVQAKYSISPVDGNGNIGIPYRIPAEFIYMGDVPRPTLTDVVANGSNIPSQRGVTVKWKGPLQGISHYQITIIPKPDGGFLSAPVVPLEFPLSDVNEASAAGDFQYDDGTGEFSIDVKEIDRDGNEIKPNIEYQVSIAAYPKAGSPAYGTNQMPLYWAVDSQGFNGGTPGMLRWAARPLPEVDPMENLILDFDLGVRGGSILIPVRGENSEFPPIELIERPFMVWKRRADIANQPWSSVSPVIEEIRRDGSNDIDDPFFVKMLNTVYFVDNSGHVPFRPYEYMVLQLNDHTYEIEKAIGPLDVTVELIPQ